MKKIFFTLLILIVGITTSLGQKEKVNTEYPTEIIDNNKSKYITISNDANYANRYYLKLNNENFWVEKNIITLKGNSKISVKIENIIPNSESILRIIQPNQETLKIKLQATEKDLKISENLSTNGTINNIVTNQIEIQNNKKEDLIIESILEKNNNIIDRNFQLLKNGESKTLKYDYLCEDIVKETQNLKINVNGNLFKTYNLNIDCKPDLEKTAYIENIDTNLDFGFIQENTTKKIYTTIENIGKEKLKLSLYKKAQNFDVRVSNNLITVTNKKINCETCKIEDQFTIKTNDPYNQYITYKIQGAVVSKELKNKTSVNIIEDCNQNLILLSNQFINVKVIQDNKTQNYNNYQKEYNIQLNCDSNQFKIIIENGIESKEAIHYIQSRNFYWISDKNVKQGESIKFTPRYKDENLKFIEISNQDNHYYLNTKENNFEINTNDIAEGEYDIHIYSIKYDYKTKITVKKK